MKTELLLTLELNSEETKLYREHGIEFLFSRSRTIDCKRLKQIDHVNDYLIPNGQGAIIWSVLDFEEMASELEQQAGHPIGSIYDRSLFKEALDDMVNSSCSEDGTRWLTVERYLEEDCRITSSTPASQKE